MSPREMYPARSVRPLQPDEPLRYVSLDRHGILRKGLPPASTQPAGRMVETKAAAIDASDCVVQLSSGRDGADPNARLERCSVGQRRFDHVEPAAEGIGLHPFHLRP